MSLSIMPKLKDGAHRQSQYPGICRRYSAKLNDWQWGYRLRLGDGWTHVHPCTTLEEARALAHLIQQGHAATVLELAAPAQPLLAALFRRYLDSQQQGKPRVDANRALRRFAMILTKDTALAQADDWLDRLALAGITIEQVKKARLSEYVDFRRQKGAAPASINRELNFIAAALHRAGDWFDMLEQWRPPAIPRVPVSHNGAKRLINDDEYQRLLDWLSADTHPGERGHQAKGRKHVYWILRGLMLTGARVSELYKLRWADVDLASDPPRLTIHGTKTAKKKPSVRVLMITSDLREVLEAQRPYAAKRKYVFTEGGNHSPKYYKIIRRACAALGIPYGRFVVDGLQFRHARHTLATELLRAGRPIHAVGQRLGHDPKTMLRHYAGVNAADDARDIEALELIEARRAGKAVP